MVTIGIGASWDADKARISMPDDYVRAVLRAGALPLLFPLTDRERVWDAMVHSVDGVIFPGGEDIDPSAFGEDTLPCCGRIIPELDRQEMYTLARIMDAKKPFLAICRGVQVLNVYMGGSLYQDIAEQYPTPIDHARFHTRAEVAHTVSLCRDSLMHRLSGAEALGVNSRHHQAIKELGRGLVPSARSSDGLVEGVEFANGYPGLGVQWHPESMAEQTPAAQALFDWLVSEAGARRNQP